MKEKNITYHIIGGGIAGLSCAWFLKDRNIKVVVYEAENKLGGRAFSYDDAKLSVRLDNATHAIVGANKFMSSFINKSEWEYTKYFVDAENSKVDTSILKNKDILFKAFCNMPVENIDRKIKKTIIKEFFPYTKSKRRVWFSKQNLTQRIINVLSANSDKINLGARLKKLNIEMGRVVSLDFGDYEVVIGDNDKVILALDNISCSKFVLVNALEHSQIVNISYLTSQTIFLPRGASFVSQKSGIADWIFVNDGIISAVISDYKASMGNLDDLAIKVWKEIDDLRGVNSGFMPAYNISYYPKAVIKQDTISNLLRPKSAKTEYSNVFIAGDWTMQNHPCCMETAVKSAQRAIKTALKSK